MNTQPISRIVFILMIIALLLSACGTVEVNVEPTSGGTPSADSVSAAPALLTDTPAPTVVLTPTPSQVVTQTPAPQPDFSSQWREVRDPGTGFGVALPCWWVTYMPTGESLAYAITVASYDEPFFMANSVKGQWLGSQPPPGAYKIDFAVTRQIDPNQTDEQAVRQALTSDENQVDLVQPRTVGKHSALLAVQSNVSNPSSTGTVYAFRLSPDSLLMVNPVKASDFTDPLVQAILNSLALSADEAVELPTIDPGPALIAKPPACQP